MRMATWYCFSSIMLLKYRVFIQKNDEDNELTSIKLVLDRLMKKNAL